MENDHKEFVAAAHKKFARFRELSKQSGPDQAWEMMLEGLPEKQKTRMTPFIAESTLAEGFTRAIPFFKSVGMEMAVVDLSNRGTDAALEIQRYCPYLDIGKEYGYETPCHVICELDIEASRRAFPEMSGEILCSQAFGSCVCLFKYERPAG
jgi:hypothetical protein